MRFCVDPNDDYEIMGSIDYGEMKNININIERCTPSSTQTCKTETEIDDFVNDLIVWTVYQ